MLEVFTAIAATIAALGAVIGPIVASRSAIRNADQRRQQDDVDRYVAFALDEDDTIARMGKNHLTFLLGTGKLTDEQTNAASEAVAASLETQAAILADPDVVAITAGDTVDAQVDTEGEDDLRGETP